MKKCILTVIFGLACLCIFTPSVIADSITDDLEKDLAVNSDLRTARTDLQDGKQFFRDANLNWEKYRDAYIDDTSEANLVEAKKYAKQLINQTIEVYDGYYLYLLTRIENIVGIDTETGDTLKSNIENEKIWLQTQRVDIAEADTVEEIEVVATDLNNYFAEKKPFLKKVIGIITSSRVNKALISLTDVKTRTANHIANLTELDKDTKTVASILTEYTEKLNQVNEKYILARDGFLSLSSTDTVDQDYTTHLNTLKEAKDLLLEADILRANIVTELIKIKASTVGGAGDLSATGEGSVLMSGELTTTVTSEQNTAVVVYDLAGDLAVESVGETAIESVGRKVTYSNFTQATITGTDYVILVTGTITEVTATGTGRAYLTGTGTYQNATGTSQSFDATNGVVYNIITS